jgi:hypothetical protein
VLKLHVLILDGLQDFFEPWYAYCVKESEANGMERQFLDS